MRSVTIALMMSGFLVSCAATPTGKGGFTVPVYSQAQRLEVYGELKTCLDCNMTIEFLKDYKVLRDQARVK
jgi:hypothetical protein